MTAALATNPVRAAPLLSLVASFDNQVTGIAVSPAGRMFACFPRWELDVAVSVAEFTSSGRVSPYPDPAWNSWSNLRRPSPAVSFVCAQCVTIDAQGFLWILDSAAPAAGFLVPGGAKLLKVDLSNDRVMLVIRFDLTAAPQGSLLSTIRVSPDGAHAFVTDGGLRGALLVVDIPSGKTRRVLDGDPRTQGEPGVVPMVDGHELRRPDNRPLTGAAHGLAIDPAGMFVYWQALSGRTLYRAPLVALTDPNLAPARVSDAVERVAQTFPAAGLWIDHAGYLFLTNPAENAVMMRAPGGAMTVAAKDDRLRWPDSMAEGADGAIFVTAPDVAGMAQFHEHGSSRTGPTAVWRIARPHL